MEFCRVFVFTDMHRVIALVSAMHDKVMFRIFVSDSQKAVCAALVCI